MNSRAFEIFFLGLGALALAATWAQIPAYLSQGFWAAQVQFWKDAVANPATVFLVVDIMVLGAVVVLWMFAECRRLGIAPAWAWLYFAGGLLIAISAFVPWFFAHRSRRLRQSGAPDSAPAGSDWIAVAFVLACVLGSVAYSFTHLPQSG